MEYQDFLNRVQDSGAVGDEERADAAAKAVLGILASQLQEDDARRLTENLPEPLTYDKLVGHQMNPTGLRADQYVDQVAQQFDMDREQAERLVDAVLHTAKDAVGEETFHRIEQHVAPDWATVLKSV